MSIKSFCTGLQHIGIPSENIEKSKEFYAGLGFELQYENDAHTVVFLKLHDLVLEIYNTVAPNPVAGAVNHFAINVTDVEAVYTEAMEAGYTLLSDGIDSRPFFEKGVRFFIIEGPNKERVEFNQIL